MKVQKKIVKIFKRRIIRLKTEWIKSVWEIKAWLISLLEKEAVDAISVIVVGRNDNYGGDFAERLRTILDWNLSVLPNPELIYVEWNQVKDRDSDCDWITKRYKNSKCYIIPKEIHDTITSNPKMPVMEYLGKNVGIRRASNKWILLINADILICSKVVSNIKKGLSSKFVYGTHYNNIKWDGQTISKNYLDNKKNILHYFPANRKLLSVVGNFVLSHKQNWELGTGYDESLSNVRAGVDENGKDNLLLLGVKPMVLGNHYHLDHNESIIHGKNDTHGYHAFNNLPYKNNVNWGMVNYKENKIKGGIWLLEKT